MHHVNEALSPTLKRRKLKTANACHMAPTQACGDIQDGDTILSDSSLHIPCPSRCPSQKCSPPPLRQVSLRPGAHQLGKTGWPASLLSTPPALGLPTHATTPSFLINFSTFMKIHSRTNSQSLTLDLVFFFFSSSFPPEEAWLLWWHSS